MTIDPELLRSFSRERRNSRTGKRRAEFERRMEGGARRPLGIEDQGGDVNLDRTFASRDAMERTRRFPAPEVRADATSVARPFRRLERLEDEAEQTIDRPMKKMIPLRRGR